MTKLAPTKSKPTLKDVAQAAGCSTAVVSTVVNSAKGNTLVSEAMARRVREAAARLGYRANFASRSLARRSTQTIGVYVPSGPWAGLGMRYESAIVQGIEQACRVHDYDVLAINLAGGGRPDMCSRKFAEQRIDGLILLHVETDAPWVSPLLIQSPNVAAVNYYGEAVLDQVNFDDRRAVELAVEHLVGLGHQRIAFVGGWRNSFGPGAALRCEGYRDGMKAAGLAVDERWVWNEGNAALKPAAALAELPHDAEAAAEHLLSLGGAAPTGIVTYNDQIAIRVMRRLQQAGVSVPGTVSVVGVDGSDFGELVTPELTSVRQPFAEMGRLAAERVIQRAAGWLDGAAAAKAKVHLAEPELILRQSTKRCGDV